MKTLLLFIVAFSSHFISAKGDVGAIIPYALVSSIQDTSLANDCAVFEFRCKGTIPAEFTLLYSIDGVSFSSEHLQSGLLEILSTPRKHIFQFYISNQKEIYTDSLLIKPGHRNLYDLYFQSANEMIFVGKPVIYLYPQEELEVTVSLDIKGTNPFLYPTYEDGWKCTAMPNGDIYMNDRVYNYLFWEANSPIPYVNEDDGFIVSKDETVAFLEKQLSHLGFSAKEQADFSTFWAPRMVQHERCFVSFILNDDCNEFAVVNIAPKPDHLYRIYMLWRPIEDDFDVVPQHLEPMKRDGFTVLEWGGIELPSTPKSKSL